MLGPSPKLQRYMAICARALRYAKHGEPSSVLECVEEDLVDPKENQVLVKMLAAPINPVDINIIQGKYPLLPSLPAVGGNEGVGKILKVGERAGKLSEGDRVVLRNPIKGTWRTHAVYDVNDIHKIPLKIGLAEAATFLVNPCSAYRMIRDFVPLASGDYVIQNGANSAVGQMVHQLCKVHNIKSIGIVRQRDDIDPLKIYLKGLGATEVFTEEELLKTDHFKTGCLRKPYLALNCIGGKSATTISRLLDNKGVMVTYGGMSRQPFQGSTAAFIFKNISFCGFCITRWTIENANSKERNEMYKRLGQLFEEGDLVAPKHEFIPLEKYKTATEATLNEKGFSGKKYIFDMDYAEKIKDQNRCNTLEKNEK